MLEFQRQVKDGNRTLDFYFKPIITPDATKYFITAKEIDITLASFEMGKTNASWLVLKPAPEWVFGLETRLSHIIEELNEN